MRAGDEKIALAHAKLDLRGVQRFHRAVDGERAGVNVKTVGLDLPVHRMPIAARSNHGEKVMRAAKGCFLLRGTIRASQI